MIELINEDYADFVNLSANLIGLDQSICKIQKPLEVLREEILNVQQTLKMTMDEIIMCLDEKNRLRDEKKRIKSFNNFEESLDKLSKLLTSNLENDPISLERMALQTIQINFSVKICSDMISDEQKALSDELHKKLLDRIKSFFLESIKQNHEKNLDRCLKIYANIDEISTAENIVRTVILSPSLNNIISEQSLQNHPNGLTGIYKQIMELCSVKLGLLLKLQKENSNLGYKFAINSFWNELERRLETNMASIFAPGNPDMFYQKYLSTLDFLNDVERLIGDPETFRNNSNYKNFQIRWNLPVYFQIRFQEIGGAIEGVCDRPINTTLISKECDGMKLTPFITAWSCITKCWKEGIFLQSLFNKFWKLSLQILSRLGRWIDVALKSDNNLEFFVQIYSDISQLELKFPEILNLASQHILPNQKIVLSDCLEDSKQLFNDKFNVIETIFLHQIVGTSQSFIKQVNDIPRLYRKTNKDVPSRHCSYVDQLVTPSKNFKLSHSQQISGEKITNFLVKIFANLTTQYYTAVDDVLVSVQKTEESLRRLKNLREKSGALTSSVAAPNSGIMTDDDKIRLQLQVDVVYWAHAIESLGINVNNVEKLNDLINLVEGATKLKL